MKKKYFGTDGIRNRVGEGLMRPDQILKLGWAAGMAIKAQGGTKALIGKDTRISGYMLESALEAGLIYAGIDVLLVGPMPTPAVSYLTQTFHADLGIVISASHNPHFDNGIKFFDANGSKISDELELEIEKLFEASFATGENCVELDTLGRAQRIDDAPGRYIEFCKSTYNGKRNLKGLHLVVDCANGAAYQVAPAVFDELGAKVSVIANQPNGFNINENCGATSLTNLQEKVVELEADLGIALDGDADRLMMVDSKGEVIDGDDLLYILASEIYSSQPGLVGTLMTNLGIESALRSKGFEFVRAQVGDRYVKEELKNRGWLLGAEGSGHVLCLDKSETGDGIVAALQVLAAIQNNNMKLEELLSQVQKTHQTMINVRVKQAFDLEKSTELKQEIADFEQQNQQTARVLIRKSGTEPVVRVMVEAVDKSVADTYAKKLAELVKTVFS